MARTIYPRTVVEKAPSHDGKPCFAAWLLHESEKDIQTPPDEYAPERPIYSLPFYETSILADSEEHIRAVAQKLEEESRDHRDQTGQGNNVRIDTHGLALPIEVPDFVRWTKCMEHHRAEVASRNATGLKDFFIPPTCSKRWKHRIVLVEEGNSKEVGSGKAEDRFVVLYFDLTEEVKKEDPLHLNYFVERYATLEKVFVDIGQCSTPGIDLFYYAYVDDGQIDEDLEQWRLAASAGVDN
ncbi:hypothetical protein C8035_v005977 [Colletotrichum spinosum]|uniref:Uncharacterized protein n=1 Tax=Colletotrichum spinosum TaxID=1347390 RepID=A0A4R8PZL3_9PEZI|nr:hypothetical protein C8035_v005977 [Colletotrichum spinosum]